MNDRVISNGFFNTAKQLTDHLTSCDNCQRTGLITCSVQEQLLIELKEFVVMFDEQDNTDKTNKCHREWAARNAPGTSVVLMQRWCDENGKDSFGKEALWMTVATIDSYNDLDHILDCLRKV